MKTLFVIAVLFVCGPVMAESYSAQDEFEQALAETILSEEHAHRLAESARNARENIKGNAEVSLRSLERALERNYSNPGPSYEAVATAYVVLSDISEQVNYHRDTRIRLRLVLESVERVSSNHSQ